MKMTAQDLKDLGIIEQIIREEEPLTRENMMQLKDNMNEENKLFSEKYKHCQNKNWFNTDINDSAISKK